VEKTIDTDIMLSVKNVHKRFDDNNVLNGVNLDIRKGEIAVILGPSGSGKTTLLRCINFLEKADTGSICVNHYTVDCQCRKASSIRTLRKKTSMVFQQYNLFRNRTAVQNVMEGMVVVKGMSKKQAQEIAESTLQEVGLLDKKDFFPSQLSGGQQQRVGIARAIVMQPDVILFDEPTSALDPELVGEVLKSISDVAKLGITMVIVTHEIAFAKEVATRAIFMEGGVVVEDGVPEQVINHPKAKRTQEFLRRINH